VVAAGGKDWAEAHSLPRRTRAWPTSTWPPTSEPSWPRSPSSSRHADG